MSNFKNRITRTPSAKFPTLGTSVSGTVLAIAEAPVPDFGENGRPTGPKLNIDGSVYTQVDITIQTESGNVVLHTGGQMFDAIDEALDKKKLENLVTGHELTVTWTGIGALNGAGLPSKEYTATVEAAKSAKSAK